MTEPQPVYVCPLTPARPKAAGKESRRGTALWSFGNTVEQQFRIKFSRTPCAHDRADVVLRHAKERGDCAEVGSGGNDFTDVEVAVGPAIEPPADTGDEEIVDRGMAERALDTDRGHGFALGIKEPGDAEDGILAQEDERVRGVVEIEFTVANGAHKDSRQGVGVNLQAEIEHGLGRKGCDCFMQAERTAPEVFAAEGVEAKDFTPFLHHTHGIPLNTEFGLRRACAQQCGY